MFKKAFEKHGKSASHKAQAKIIHYEKAQANEEQARFDAMQAAAKIRLEKQLSIQKKGPPDTRCCDICFESHHEDKHVAHCIEKHGAIEFASLSQEERT